MNRRFALAAVLAVAGSSLLVLAPVADAVSAPTSAWWSRLATTTPTDELPAALPVPAPATPGTAPVGVTVPEGQLLVEGAPDGVVSIAAIRWELDEADSSPSLVLPVGEGSTLNPQSVVLACKTATPWTQPEADPGMWDTKPLVDGSRCINGVIADDLSTVGFGVQPLVSGNILDVVLVPGKDTSIERPPGVPEPPADLDGSVFRWLLERPTAESLEVVADSDFTEGEGDRFVTPPSGSPPDLGPVGPSGTPAFDSAPPPESGPPLDAAAPALEPQDLAPSVPDVSRALPASASPDPVNRTLGFVLLALAGLVATWAYLTSNGIGPGAVAADGAVVGGLSRFARPRVTPPTRLS